MPPGVTRPSAAHLSISHCSGCLTAQVVVFSPVSTLTPEVKAQETVVSSGQRFGAGPVATSGARADHHVVEVVRQLVLCKRMGDSGASTARTLSTEASCVICAPHGSNACRKKVALRQVALRSPTPSASSQSAVHASCTTRNLSLRCWQSSCWESGASGKREGVPHRDSFEPIFRSFDLSNRSMDRQVPKPAGWALISEHGGEALLVLGSSVRAAMTC